MIASIEIAAIVTRVKSNLPKEFMCTSSHLSAFFCITAVSRKGTSFFDNVEI